MLEVLFSIRKCVHYMLVEQMVTTNRGDIGISTGSVLPSLLWNLVVIELLGEMEGQGCRVVGYAVGLMIIVRRSFFRALMKISQTISR